MTCIPRDGHTVANKSEKGIDIAEKDATGRLHNSHIIQFMHPLEPPTQSVAKSSQPPT
jgi:hypothetical protein